MSRVKEINWSYPTSDNAKAFGYAGTGCYTLAVGEVGKPLVAVFGHSDKVAVERRAASVDCEWSAATRFLRSIGR